MGGCWWWSRGKNEEEGKKEKDRNGKTKKKKLNEGKRNRNVFLRYKKPNKKTAGLIAGEETRGVGEVQVYPHRCTVSCKAGQQQSQLLAYGSVCSTFTHCPKLLPGIQTWHPPKKPLAPCTRIIIVTSLLTRRTNTHLINQVCTRVNLLANWVNCPLC